jgi:hypothetical protein
VTSYHLNSWGAHHPDPRHLVGPAAFPPSVGLTLTSLDPCALYPATVVASIFPLPSPSCCCATHNLRLFNSVACTLRLVTCTRRLFLLPSSRSHLPSCCCATHDSRLNSVPCTLQPAPCDCFCFPLPSPILLLHALCAVPLHGFTFFEDLRLKQTKRQSPLTLPF